MIFHHSEVMSFLKASICDNKGVLLGVILEATVLYKWH